MTNANPMWRWAVGTLFLFFGILCWIRPGLCEDTLPLSVTVSLPESHTFAQAESVKITYDIKNVSDSFIACDIELQYIPWLWAELLQDNKQVRNWHPHFKASQFDSVPMLTKGSIRNHSEVLASDHFLTQVSPGDYILRVHTDLPYAIMGQKTIDIERGKSWQATALQRLQSSKLSQVKIFDFAVTITPCSSNEWKERTHKLYTALLASNYNTDRQIMSELVTMPEAEALPTWRTVLFNKNLEQYEFAKCLCEFPSRNTADLLLSLQFTDPIRGPRKRLIAANGNTGAAATVITEDHIFSVIPLLRMMAKMGDTDLKSYIEAQLEVHKKSTFYVPEDID